MEFLRILFLTEGIKLKSVYLLYIAISNIEKLVEFWEKSQRWLIKLTILAYCSVKLTDCSDRPTLTNQYPPQAPPCFDRVLFER